MKLLWTSRARNDLVEIAGYIADDNPTAAKRWIERIRSQAKKTTEFPQIGRVVPEFGRGDIREIVFKNYRIVYRIHGTGIHVLTVFEGHLLMRPIDPVPGEQSKRIK